MKPQNSDTVFEGERAARYDERFAKLAPMKDALHLFMSIVLSTLPENARVLCVGVGTGDELVDLAKRFPNWHFTAVDPAAAMLTICKQRARDGGFASRCTFHEGYLDTLPSSAPFDAATSLLVSHFLMQAEERQGFFSQIADRLTTGGYLINADISTDMASATYPSLVDKWVRMLQHAGMPTDEVDQFRGALGTMVSVLPSTEVESIIKAAGFELPVKFFQSLLIGAWYAQKA